MRFFSALTGVGILMLADGLILVRLARVAGVYLALAIEGAVTIVAAVIAGSSINALIRKIRGDAHAGRYRPHVMATLLTVVGATVLLFLPGFASDAIGLLVYLYPGRTLVASLVLRRNAAAITRAHEYLTMDLFSRDESPESGG